MAGGDRSGGVGERRGARPSYGPARHWLSAAARLGTGAWIIGLIATFLAGWAVVELIHADAGLAPVQAVLVPVAAEGAGAMRDVVELHRLLPDATDDLGRRVRLDGVVVGTVTPGGFWVRDLRDNIVFVAHPSSSGGRPAARQGDMVRIRGAVELLPPGDDVALREAAGLALPPTAIIVRAVEIRAAAGGIEVLD